jgi:hypothetical protein
MKTALNDSQDFPGSHAKFKSKLTQHFILSTLLKIKIGIGESLKLILKYCFLILPIGYNIYRSSLHPVILLLSMSKYR